MQENISDNYKPAYLWQNVFLLLALISLSFYYFSSDLTIKDLHYISLRGHFFSIAPALAILSILCFIFIYNTSLKINKIDLVLVIYALFTLFNYYINYNNYNQELIKYILLIFLSLILKQLYYSKFLGNVILYLCFFWIIYNGFYEAIIGQWQLLGLYPSSNKLFAFTGSFYNPGPYAIFLSPIFIISLSIILTPPSHPFLARPLFYLSWLTLIGIILVLPATQSRSAWIGLGIGSLFVIFIKYKKDIIGIYSTTKISHKVIVVIFLVLFIFISIFFMYQLKSDSVNGRFLVWWMSLSAIKNNILLGIGFGQYRANYGNFQSVFMQKHFHQSSIVERADYVQYTFNDFLQVLIENGLVGVTLFITILLLVLSNGLKIPMRNKPFLVGSIGALLSLIIAAIFSFPFELPPIWFLFLVLVSIVSFLAGGEMMHLFSKETFVNIAVLFIISLMIIVLTKEINLIKIRATIWNKASSLYSKHLYKEAAEAYVLVYKKLPDDPKVLLSYGKALSMAGYFKQSAIILEKAANKVSDPILYTNLGTAYLKLGNYNLSEKAYQKAVYILPNKLYPRYLLAKMYIAKGDSIRSVETANSIVSMPAPIQSPATRQILLEISQILTRK